MGGKNRICFLIVVSLFLFFNSCKSPESEEIKPTASIQISVNQEPIYLIYNWNNKKHCLSTNVTLSEMNGVRCNISEVELNFIYQNQIYEPSAFTGGGLSPYGQLQIQVHACTEYAYDKIRINVIGEDENGHGLSTSKDFSIEYIPNIDGIYKGTVSGTQNGHYLSMTVTFKVSQEAKSVTGTWVTNANTSGTFEGTFEKKGNKWEFTSDITQSSPCYGLFKADGEIKDYGGYIKGSYIGTSSCLGNVSASFTVYRQ